MKAPPCLFLLLGNFGSMLWGDAQTVTLDPTCPLDCHSSGQCARGNADFSQFTSTENSMPFLKDLNNGGYFCQCPPGRTGLLCEREYESCGDGAHFCFHGGSCLSGIKDLYGNEQHYCDCGEAEFDGKTYAGKFCEADAVDFCGSATEYGNVFCTNGGKCRNNWLSFLDQPCVCQNGFDGPHCEYKAGERPGCGFQCLNGGGCRIGSKDYPPNQAYKEFWETHDDNRYCACTPGFFGLQCEIEGQTCGEEHCFNGATCVSQTMSDGSTSYFCDCTTADARGSSYAGLRCEAESTSFCTKMGDHNGHQFCVNGGSCKADSHLGCQCLEGFNGPICEFRDSQTRDMDCSLKCQNNGVCRNGAKDVDFLKKFNMEMPKSTEAFEHCVCPKGYVGIYCELMVDVCPGGEHVCMNGAECVPDDTYGRLKYKCDCDTIHSPFHKYAGDFCELKSSELCTFNGRPGTGKNKDAYCVNGGRCKGHASEQAEHPGCQCPAGFDDSHCETLAAGGHLNLTVETVVDDPGHGSKGGLSRVGIILIVLCVGFGLLCATGVHFYKRQQQQRLASSYDDSVCATNLIARGMPEPPTMDHILAMRSLQDDSNESSMLHDVSQRSHSCKSAMGDGLYRVEDTSSTDLVNVAII